MNPEFLSKIPGKVLEIRKHDDPALRVKCTPVQEVNDETVQLMADMVKTMVAFGGIGLAAPQVGSPFRVIVVRNRSNVIPMANPVIIHRCKRMVPSHEGCLSFPGVFADLKRHNSVIVDYLDLDGKECRIKLTKQGSIALQHEIDHLDGVLFMDERGA
ncbi:MAG: peptide deformylase [Deltaproteobacteria bacterium]|nr:peptide deformylase [Deltaproteobacteria bacterium]